MPRQVSIVDIFICYWFYWKWRKLQESGAVRLYVNCVTAAILETCEIEVVHWPNAVKWKFFISDRIQEKYDFPNCVGFVDRMILPLDFKPNLYGEEYYCHKGCYSVHCLIIFDDELRIFDYLGGGQPQFMTIVFEKAPTSSKKLRIFLKLISICWLTLLSVAVVIAFPHSKEFVEVQS